MNATVAKECGSAFIKSRRPAGVVATGKHWPGLGAAFNVPLHDLCTIDEVPYMGAIAAGVDMVMASWAIYPTLDLNRPSGLSTKWMTPELRSRLGFEGVTITNALEAGALEAFGSNATRAILTVQAAMAITLASARDVSQGQSVFDGLLAAVNNGTISSNTFAESKKRVLHVRSLLY